MVEKSLLKGCDARPTNDYQQEPLKMLYRTITFWSFALLWIAAAGYAQEPNHQRASVASTTLARIQTNAAPAIVRLYYGRDREGYLGTGTIVTADGYIVASSSASHRVIDDQLLKIQLHDGTFVNGRALGWSGQNVLGLLKIDSQGRWPHVEFGSSSRLRSNDPCIAIGYPFNLEVGEPDNALSVKSGRIGEFGTSWFEASGCSVMLGGGYGLFDTSGKLIGITAMIGPLTRHCRVEVLQELWPQLVAGGNLDRDLIQQPLLEFEADTRAGAIAEIASASEISPQVADMVKQASVRIPELAASGTIVTADGYIATCGHHRGRRNQVVHVILADGRTASGVVLGKHKLVDIGLLKITDKGTWPHVRLALTSALKLDAPCLSIGYPVSFDGKMWQEVGEVTVPEGVPKRRDAWSASLFCTTTADGSVELDGTSGGGAFNARGELVGILLTNFSPGVVGYARVELFRKYWKSLDSQ